VTPQQLPLEVSPDRWAEPTTVPLRTGQRVRHIDGTPGTIVGWVIDWPNVEWDRGTSAIAGRTLCAPPEQVEVVR